MDANQEQEDQDETSNQYEPSMQCSKPTKLSGSSGHTAAAVGIRKQLSGLEGGAPHIPMKPMNTCKFQAQIDEITELGITHENNTNASQPRKCKTSVRMAEEDKDMTIAEPNEAQSAKRKYATFQKGKYELLKLIGQGMTSKVFMVRLAKDHKQIFALKVITNDYW